MIIHKKGNLLESWKDGINVIAHQSNCIMGYGSGIALQIRNTLPGAYEVFKRDTREPGTKLGTYTVADSNVGEFDRVYNLYGQLYCGGGGKVYTDYNALYKSIETMLMVESTIYSGDKIKVGFPFKIGCGLAGGDWGIVLSIIKELSDTHDSIDVYLYEFEG